MSAAQDFTAGKLAVALAYALGSGAVLYVLMLGGRRLVDRLKPSRAWIQAATGAVMVLVAVAMIADLDLEFQDAIADDLPSVLVNPSGELEGSGAISDDLTAVRGGGDSTSEGGQSQAEEGKRLPVYGPAPDFVDTQQWFNTPGGRALSIDGLTAQGKTVLIDFWTYTCINCIRTLPYVEAWSEKYARDGLVVVGVHSPEFAFEKDAGNVEQAIADDGLTYPVVQDNELGTWNAFGNQYWPAKYLIDPDGNFRYVHFGEGDYDNTEAAIRSVLGESGDEKLGGQADPGAVERADRDLRTPETYLGEARAQGWVNGPRPGAVDYGSPPPADLQTNEFAYEGEWNVGGESARAGANAGVALGFQARRVFLVLGSPGEPREVEVLLDGKAISAADAGDDVHDGVVTVDRQRLYRLVDLARAGRHRLELRIEPGVEGYAFTFG